MVTSGLLCAGSRGTPMVLAEVIAYPATAARLRLDLGTSVSRDATGVSRDDQILLRGDRVSTISPAHDVLLPNNALAGVLPNALPGVKAWSPPV